MTLVLLLLAAALPPASAAPVATRQLTAELIAADFAIVPGRAAWIGLRLEHAPSWHTYWTNPGDAGFATSLEWELPAGFSAGPLLFPAPHHFQGQGGLAGYGYEGETVLLTEIKAPGDLAPGATITLKAKAGWLACDPSVCVPGGADLEISLPVARSAAPSPSKPLIDQYLAQVPAIAPGWNLSATDAGTEIRLRFAPPEGVSLDPALLRFFPENKNLVAASAPQAFSRASDGTIELTLPRAKPGDPLPDPITGVLTIPGQRAVLASTNPSAYARTPDPTIVNQKSEIGNQLSLLTALLFSFLGGIILNVMPCVFPVISLKVMSFVNQAGGSRRDILHHGLAFAAGVLIFFWILAAAILAVRAGGNLAGWGLQLQQPGFVMAMAILMLLIALNLFGVFEFGASLTGVGGRLISGSGISGSFWNGALATLLATPCTGPFMASALGYAVGRPPAVSFLVFTFLALGMASPYVLLAAFPGLIRKLPRPGAWMETFKQAMGFPMLAVALWLTVVLSAQLSSDGLLLFLAAVLIVSVALWLYGRFATPAKPRRNLARAAALALMLVALLSAGKAARLRAPVSSTDIADVIQGHREAGRNVLVDFTALWCATCQANKPALHSDSVEAALEKHNVAFVVADYTNNDPRITEFLQAWGRDGVPFYPLFPADPAADPIILPQVLTPDTIIEHLEKLP